MITKGEAIKLANDFAKKKKYKSVELIDSSGHDIPLGFFLFDVIQEEPKSIEPVGLPLRILVNKITSSVFEDRIL